MSFKVHFYGHSSLCLEARDQALFFHPNFSPQNFFYRHTTPPLPGAPLFEKTSAILLSSGAYDHCDLSSFKYFTGKIPIFAPKGLGKWISHHLENPVTELQASSPATQHGLAIEAQHTIHGMNALRPFRGCAPLNMLVTWQDKTCLFLFHPPTQESLQVWKSETIDALFISLGESPIPSLWSGFFSARPNLPVNLDRVITGLGQAKRIVPIGWGGFAPRTSQGLSLYEQWQLFLQAQSNDLQTKTKRIEPGQFIEVE